MSSKLDIIADAEHFIGGVTNNADILTLLEAEGFTAENIADGHTKLTAAKDVQSVATTSQGKISSAKRDRDQAKKDLTDFQRKLRKRAKTIGIEHPILIDRLPVQVKFPSALNKLLTLSRDMLKICLEDEQIKTILASNGYPETRLQEGQTLQSDLESKQQEFIEAKGAKQQATANLNKALKSLKLWYKIGKEAALAAIEDDTQLLEKLGIVM